MSKVSAAFLAILAAVLGFGGGVAFTSHRLDMWNEAATAFITADRVNTLSLLRLNDVERTITINEDQLDTEILSLAKRSASLSKPLGPATRTLKQAKAYRNLYPSTRPEVTHALSAIPQMNDYKKECKGGLCRLLETSEQAVQQAD